MVFFQKKKTITPIIPTLAPIFNPITHTLTPTQASPPRTLVNPSTSLSHNTFDSLPRLSGNRRMDQKKVLKWLEII
jgi:hypothetical protein